MIKFSPGCCCDGGGGTITTPCCSELLPETIHATLSASGLCATIDGMSFELTYNAAGPWWEVLLPHQCTPFGADDDLYIRFSCEAPHAACEDFILTFQTQIAGTGTPLSTQNNGTPVSCSCEPLSMVYTMNSGFGGFGCCFPGGAVTVTITE